MSTTPVKPKPKAVGLAAIAGGTRKRPSQHSAPEVEVRPTKYFPGDVIGSKYRLTSVLGEGGMGSVWLAHNLALDADVAIKLIRRELANLDTSARLLTEARAAARLGHPSIVRVFDFGQTEFYEPFIVMELLRGESIGELLDRERRLAATHAVQMMLPVASALVAAHAKGIVHRDLKPENVLLVTEESGATRPKVVDFGIAKLTSETLDEQRKQVETVVGSPDYMSPEQARGEVDVDQRADVWAFAVVLYEMIAGRRPFEGPNYHALLTSIVEDEPPPLGDQRQRQVDHELWKIVRRGLEKDRRLRWGSMKAMGGALARWALSRGVEHDVGGTSIALHWLDERTRRSLAPASRRPQPFRHARPLTPSDPRAPTGRPSPNPAARRVSSGGRPHLELVQAPPAEGLVERSETATWLDPSVRPRIVSPLRLVSSPPCTAPAAVVPRGSSGERATLHVPFEGEVEGAHSGSTRPPLIAVHLDEDRDYRQPSRLGSSAVVVPSHPPRRRTIWVGAGVLAALIVIGSIGVGLLRSGRLVPAASETQASDAPPMVGVAPHPSTTPVELGDAPSSPETSLPETSSTKTSLAKTPLAETPPGPPPTQAAPSGSPPPRPDGQVLDKERDFPKPKESVYDASQAEGPMPVPLLPNF